MHHNSGVSPSQSEGDVNHSERRAQWQRQHLDTETRELLAREAPGARVLKQDGTPVSAQGEELPRDSYFARRIAAHHPTVPPFAGAASAASSPISTRCTTDHHRVRLWRTDPSAATTTRCAAGAHHDARLFVGAASAASSPISTRSTHRPP